VEATFNGYLYCRKPGAKPITPRKFINVDLGLDDFSTLSSDGDAVGAGTLE